MFMLSFIDSAIVLSMFMLSIIFEIICGLFGWKWICAGFFDHLFISVLQSSKLKIWIYWSESNSWIYYLYLNKNWKNYWSQQSFTGLGAEYLCSY
jgi:hypothetical protein